MKSNSSSHFVRRKCPPSRYYPYARGKLSSANEEMKEVVVGLGVELSLHVAEAMFLLCDDIPTLKFFCYKLWKFAIHPSVPVSKRLLRVIYHVYSKDIKPKNGAYQDSVPFQLISSTWKDFCDGIIVLHRLVKILQGKEESFDDRLLSSAIAKYKQLLKSLEDKLRSAKHVSEANGFAREKIESNISHLWKSLFDEEAVDLWTSLFDEEAPGFDEEATPKLYGVQSVHCGLISSTWKNFVVGIRDLDTLALLLGRGSCLFGRKYTSSVEEALEKLDESLRSARDVSEANGFARDAMEPKMLELWEYVFDKETEEA